MELWRTRDTIPVGSYPLESVPSTSSARWEETSRIQNLFERCIPSRRRSPVRTIGEKTFRAINRSPSCLGQSAKTVAAETRCSREFEWRSTIPRAPILLNFFGLGGGGTLSPYRNFRYRVEGSMCGSAPLRARGDFSDARKRRPRTEQSSFHDDGIESSATYMTSQ